MGCGWTAATDFARIPAIEAVNGTASVGPLSGIGFWEARLNAGFRITAVGGSDNHDPGLPGARGVGVPTTVVHAAALSQDAVLAAIRAGHVFVDAQGARDRRLEVTATAGGATAEMGDQLAAAGPVRLSVRVLGVEGGRLAFSGPGAGGLASADPLRAEETRTFDLPAANGWLRVDVRGPDGALWLLGNPIYVTP